MIPIRVEVDGMTINVSQVIAEQVVESKGQKVLVLLFPFMVQQVRQSALGGPPEIQSGPFQIILTEEQIEPYRDAVARATQAAMDAISGVDVEEEGEGDDSPLDGLPSRN